MPIEPTGRPINLVDKRGGVPRLVAGTLIRDLPASRLQDVEKVWKLLREEAARKNPKLQNGHWDWRHKVATARDGRHRLVGIECQTSIQGLMAIWTPPRPAELTPDAFVLYVDYIE